MSSKPEQAKQTIIDRLRADGVVNPAGLATAAVGPIFLAAIPVTTFLARPNGLLEKTVNGLCSSLVYIVTGGTRSVLPQTSKIAALSTLYIAVTYAFSGAASAAGVDAGNDKGRDNLEPRKQVAGLKGLPLRLHSAHYNLMEMFPGFALVAALAQATCPWNEEIVTLLGLHVMSKVFLYYPSYLLNYGAVRSIAHVLATGSVINVGVRLMKLLGNKV